jgi:dipeptidyl aminopeptidase/acylaminoacyl peptidase
MKRHLLRAVLLWLATGTIAAAQMTPEQMLDRRSIADLRFSPDGSRLSMTVTGPPDTHGRDRDVWVADVQGRKPRRVTTSEKADYHGRWSPDGQTLAFLSERRDRAQIYLLPLAGGESFALTESKTAVQGFEWAPDGKSIAFLAAVPKTSEQEALEKAFDDERVVDRDDPPAQLWTVNVETRAVKQVTSGTTAFSEIAWAGANRLVVIANDKPGSDQFTDRLATIDVRTGSISWVGGTKGPIGDAAVSPDGRTVAFLGARVDGPSPHDVYVQSIDGGAATNLTATRIDRSVISYAWRPEGSILVAVEDGVNARLWTVHVDGQGERLPDADVMPSAVAVSAKGQIAFVGETSTRAPEVYVRSADGAISAATAVNTAWQASAVSAPDIVKYKSVDGVEIEAMLFKPPPSASGKPPLVVLIHGGPTGRWADSFQLWSQLLVARGYAVLTPNIRGSSGYGHAFLAMNRGDWGGGDFKDVMAGVDHLVNAGMVDDDRVGIGGWSYGGYMAAWAVTQTTRFRAAVAGAGMSDLATEYGTERDPAYDEWFYGLPYEHPEGFAKSSPLTYVRRAKTPTLLLHGEEDPVDPLGQSQAFYRALKRYGVTTDLVIYPREPHGFRERAHILDMLRRMTSWFDDYLKPVRAPTAPQASR